MDECSLRLICLCWAVFGHDMYLIRCRCLFRYVLDSIGMGILGCIGICWVVWLSSRVVIGYDL